MNTEQLKQAAMAAKTGNLEAELVFEALASPNKILALPECVDALRGLLNRYDPYALFGYEKNVIAEDNARASLKNL